MKLCWDLDKVNDLLHELIELTPQSPEDAFLIDSAIDIYDEMISSSLIDKINSKNVSNTLINTPMRYSYRIPKSSFLDFLNIFDENVVNYINYFSKNIAKDSNFIKLNTDINYSKKRLSNNKLYNNVINFYSSILPEYNDYINNLFFNNFIATKKHQISSYSLFDEYNNLEYILLDKNVGSVIDIDAVHEISHCLRAYNKTIISNDKNYLAEIDSIFMELIYTKRNLNKNSLAYLFEYFNFLKEEYINFRIMNNLNKKRVNKNNIVKEYKYYDIFNDIDDHKILEYFSDTNFVSDSSYAFSFIVVLHLLEIYNKDPEKAIYLYNNELIKKKEDDISLKKLEFNIKDPDYGIQLFRDFEDDLKKEKTRILK